jgi:putative SOS response-associated peptidase YedK
LRIRSLAAYIIGTLESRFRKRQDMLDLRPKGEGRRDATNDIFAFLTTEPNKVVGAIHPKAMPVILTTREEIDI